MLTYFFLTIIVLTNKFTLVLNLVLGVKKSEQQRKKRKRKRNRKREINRAERKKYFTL